MSRTSLPSLSSQIAARQKLLAIPVVQLGIVWLTIAEVYSAPESVHDWIRDNLFTGLSVIAAYVAHVVALIVLYCGRAKEPSNWYLLVVFTVSDAVVYIVIDLLLDVPIVLCVMAYVWLCVAFMLAGASLTTTTADWWWKDVSWRAHSREGEGRRMVPPAVLAIAGLTVGLIVAVIICEIAWPTLLETSGLWLCAAFAAFVCGVFSIQVGRTKATHEYMRGVIYLHVNLLVAKVVVIVTLFILIAKYSH